MPSKRDPGKQARQARNQARRQALAARREQATAPPVERASAAAKEAKPRPAAGSLARGGLLGGDRPVGWRAALASLLLAIVAFGALSVDTVTVDEEGNAVSAVELAPLYRFAQYSLGSGLQEAYGEGDEPPGEVAAAIDDMVAGPGDEEAGSLSAYWPLSVIFPLPVLIAGLAFWLVHRGMANGRQLMFCLFGMFFASMMTGIFFLPALVALGISSFQVRRVEAAAALAARRAAEEAAGDDDVIDVDEVDELDDLDDDLDELDEDTELDDTEVDEAQDEDEPRERR